MNHIDSAVKERAKSRNLKKTFGASQPVPGTYDDIMLSDAFLTGKIRPEKNRHVEGDYAHANPFVEYFFELPQHQEEQSTDIFDDLLMMYAFFEDNGPQFSLEPAEDGSPVPAMVTSLAGLNLASALSLRTSAKGKKHQPLLRMRRCKKSGTVTYTVV